MSILKTLFRWQTAAAMIILFVILVSILALLGEWALAATFGAILLGALSALAVMTVSLLRAMQRQLARGNRKLDVIRSSAGTTKTPRGIRNLRIDLHALRVDTSTSHQRIELAERRILGILESLRLSLEQDQTGGVPPGHRNAERGELSGQVEGPKSGSVRAVVKSDLARVSDSVVSELTAVARDETKQVEALLQLLPKIEPRAPLPPAGRGAMDARDLLHLSYLCQRFQPKKVLELGGEDLTIWLGYLLEHTDAHILRVDHDEKFSRRMRESIKYHHLGALVRTRTSPLEQVRLSCDTYRWYAADTFNDVEEIDLLVVNESPEAAGKLSHYPALPMLRERLAKNCTIVLGDSGRSEELEAAARWLSEFPEFQRIDEGVSRLSVLQRVI